MQDASQHESRPRSTAGYRPLVSADLTHSMETSAYGYIAAAAAGLGLLVGVAVAVTTSQARVAAAPRVADSIGAHTSGLSMLPASYVGSTASLLSQVDPHRKANVAASPLVKVSETSKHIHSHKKHGLRKLLSFIKPDKEHKQVKRMAYVSPKPAADVDTPADEPTALQRATAAAAQGPFFLGIQGDVTVANYDATTGTIQTYEGETYLLAKNTAESNSIPWQDYPFNVHYNCDGIGNCTLSHAGASAIAKLTR
jgi:hypothetical protein